MQVACVKGKEMFASKNIIVNEDSIEFVIIGTEDVRINLDNIPCLKLIDEEIYYTQIGTCMYFALKDNKNKIVFLYIIEQELERGTLKIKDIYSTTYVSKENILERFFRFNTEFEQKNLRVRLPELIKKFDVIIEKDFLINKIFEYLETEAIKEITTMQTPIIKTSSLEEMFKIKKEVKSKSNAKPRRPITCYGVEYRSMKQFCEAFNLPHTSVFQFFERGLTAEEIVEKYQNGEVVKGNRNNLQAKKVVCNGIEYPTIQEFCKKNNISLASYDRYKKKGYTPEEMLEKINDPNRCGKTGGYMQAQKVVVDGVEYPSIEQMCKAFGKSGGSFFYYKNKGYTPEEIVELWQKDKKLIKEPRQDLKMGLKKYNYLGEELTIKELSELSGIPTQVLYTRLQQYKWTVEQAVETPLYKNRKVEGG